MLPKVSLKINEKLKHIGKVCPSSRKQDIERFNNSRVTYELPCTVLGCSSTLKLSACTTQATATCLQLTVSDTLLVCPIDIKSVNGAWCRRARFTPDPVACRWRSRHSRVENPHMSYCSTWTSRTGCASPSLSGSPIPGECCGITHSSYRRANYGEL